MKQDEPIRWDDYGAIWQRLYGDSQSEPLKLINCKTEREQMLCEQVLRMCRGEESQFVNFNEDWIDNTFRAVFIDYDYRAKPKKELVVPWDMLEDYIANISIDKRGAVFGWCEIAKEYVHLPIKLDLTDIDLPVTVKRPSGEK